MGVLCYDIFLEYLGPSTHLKYFRLFHFIHSYVTSNSRIAEPPKVKWLKFSYSCLPRQFLLPPFYGILLKGVKWRLRGARTCYTHFSPIEYSIPFCSFFLLMSVYVCWKMLWYTTSLLFELPCILFTFTFSNLGK